MTGGTMLVDLAAEMFARWHGAPPSELSPVAGDGSDRRYWRLAAEDGTTAVAAHGADREENRAFLAFSRTFRELGLPVPEVYAADEDAGVWLLEDLGDTTLFDAIVAARDPGSDVFPVAVLPLYRSVLEVLPRFQIEGGKAINFRQAYPRAAFDRQSILWDLNYFKYHFLKLAHIPFHEARLEKDFGTLARFLLGTETGHFLYRDLQSRNVMVRESDGVQTPWFIDYQGGRRGALQYDVASLLYDAKANLPTRTREGLLAHYLDAVERLQPIDRAAFAEVWPGYVLVRVLQALGAYGYRGFFERKPRFLQSVPYAAENLRRMLTAGLPIKAPELAAALEQIVERWGQVQAPLLVPDGLEVHISSFRYAAGYPQDTSGHGGGYVFDCRGIPNPGRERAYRGLTGLDPETIAFLEARPEADEFWSHVRSIVEAHVRTYLSRGFNNLGVHFGCTGGQHRSVFMAERLAGYLRAEHPGVRVRVTHREQPDWPRRSAAV